MVRYITFAIILQLFISCSNNNTNEQSPNVIFINIDDMGWNDVSFMGSQYYDTPNIDALAADAMVFTQGYAAAANCAPSRASINTGKWTTRHQIYTVSNSDRGASKDRKLIPIKNTTLLSKEFPVIAQKLKASGYVTCHSGKWHLSKDPLKYGFDVNIAGGHQGAPGSYYPPYGNKNNRVDIQSKEGNYLTDVIMDQTLSFLDKVEEPFFLHYTPYAVHTPIHKVDSLMSKYVDKAPYKGQKNPEYATMIDNLDRNIGHLIKKLKDRNLFENALIIFTSDNGGYYGKITKQKPLRAGKGSYYEGGIRVPFFFHWKGKIPNGLNDKTPISHLDIFPTIMEAVGDHSMDNEFDGNSILNSLTNGTVVTERALFWHFPIYLQGYDIKENENRDSLFRTRPGSVVRKGDWKLHYYFEDNEVELYNLIEDVGEQNDLSKINATKTNQLLNELKNWWVDTNAPIPTQRNPDYVASKIN
tara:strand:- start:12142 stop:13557 length:1416 start_codon:yes stop_codon:yes gene_type:complete